MLYTYSTLDLITSEHEVLQPNNSITRPSVLAETENLMEKYKLVNGKQVMTDEYKTFLRSPRGKSAMTRAFNSAKKVQLRQELDKLNIIAPF